MDIIGYTYSEVGNLKQANKHFYPTCVKHGSALLEGFLGSRRWMAAEMGQRGGKATTEAKAAAARENGKLGGRPRKPKELTAT